MVVPSSFAFRSSHVLSSSSRLIRVRIMRTSDIDRLKRYHDGGPLSRVDDNRSDPDGQIGGKSKKIAKRRKSLRYSFATADLRRSWSTLTSGSTSTRSGWKAQGISTVLSS